MRSFITSYYNTLASLVNRFRYIVLRHDRGIFRSKDSTAWLIITNTMFQEDNLALYAVSIYYTTVAFSLAFVTVHSDCDRREEAIPSG